MRLPLRSRLGDVAAPGKSLEWLLSSFRGKAQIPIVGNWDLEGTSWV